jgi:hypothetical protein
VISFFRLSCLFAIKDGNNVAAVIARVTRLSEFSPIALFFSIKNFFNCQSSPKIRLTFLTVKYILIFAKMVWAKLWATFFPNASGRPGVRQQVCSSRLSTLIGFAAYVFVVAGALNDFSPYTYICT